MMALSLVLSLLLQVVPADVHLPGSPAVPAASQAEPEARSAGGDDAVSGFLRTAGAGLIGAVGASLAATLVLAPLACVQDPYGIGPGCAYAGGLAGLLVGVPVGSAIGVWLGGRGAGYLVGSIVGALAGSGLAALTWTRTTNVPLIISAITVAPLLGALTGYALAGTIGRVLRLQPHATLYAAPYAGAHGDGVGLLLCF